MSPLDRLQELLDKRGVKYERRSFDSHNHGSVEYMTWRGVGGLEFNAICSISDPDMLFIDNEIISPEDTVDVTVGRETCHTVLMDCFGNPPYNKSGLNGNDIACGCSECGVPWSTMGIFRGNKLKHNFKACPLCGRKVVE